MMKKYILILVLFLAILNTNNANAQSVASQSANTVNSILIQEFTICNEIVGRNGVTVQVYLQGNEYFYYFLDSKEVYFFADKDDSRSTIKFGNMVSEEDLKKFKKKHKVSALSFNCVNEKGHFVFGTKYNRPW